MLAKRAYERGSCRSRQQHETPGLLLSSMDVIKTTPACISNGRRQLAVAQEAVGGLTRAVAAVSARRDGMR